MKVASGLAVLSLGLVPAAGMASGADYTPEPPKPPKGSKAEPKGKAYGYHCKGQSKKHVKGEKGTAFSRCVKGVNQMRKEEREKEAETAV